MAMRMKSGMAAKTKESKAEYIMWGRTDRDIPFKTRRARAKKAREKATGRPERRSPIRQRIMRRESMRATPFPFSFHRF
jgi:hypothetical protein